MKWFHLLKSKTGKLVFGIPQMAAIAGVGLVISYSALQLDKAEAQKERVRSLSAISSDYNYGGMRQDGRGSLTSINVKDGLNQVATAEERARIEAGRTGGGDFGLGAADRVGDSLSGSMTGAAAETSDTEGLGMGRNAVLMDESSGNGGGNAASRTRADLSRVSGRAGRTAPSQLAPASMTHASGGGVSGSFGGPTSGGVTGGTAAGNSGREGYQFTGAMPSGTNPVSLGGADGRGASHFMAGGRNVSVASGKNTKTTGNELKDISKRSADAAHNRYRSANEGGRAFQNSFQDSRAVSGLDVSVDEMSSEDLSSAPPPRDDSTIEENLNNYKDKLTDEEKERSKKRNWLVTAMTALFVLTVFACKLIAMLMSAPGDIYLKLSYKAWAWITFVGVCLAAAAVGTQAGLFGDKYGWSSGLAYGVMGVAGACVIAALTVTLMGAAGKLKGTKEDYVAEVRSSIKSGVGMVVQRGVSFGVQELKNSDLASNLDNSGKNKA